MRDLEIRGAGNLLGAEQSGYINDLGFDMYLDLLEKAVAELKGAPIVEKEPPVIDVEVDALIPEDYIEDASLRLGFYRRIASASSAGELEKVAGEFSERFGPPPPEARNLLNVMSLRIASERAGVALIKQFDGRVRFRLAPGASPKIETLAKAYKGRLKFQTEGFELAFRPGEAPASVLEEIARVLGHLTVEKLSAIF
jgi:transcription-repair coupling factor (superfamily II helicase)